MPAHVGFGFDCVIKAFRIGKKVSRSVYHPNTRIFYDPETEEVYCSIPDLGVEKERWVHTGKDFMAKDWFVVENQ